MTDSYPRLCAVMIMCLDPLNYATFHQCYLLIMVRISLLYKFSCEWFHWIFSHSISYMLYFSPLNSLFLEAITDLQRPFTHGKKLSKWICLSPLSSIYIFYLSNSWHKTAFPLLFLLTCTSVNWYLDGIKGVSQLTNPFPIHISKYLPFKLIWQNLVLLFTVLSHFSLYK